MSDYVADRVGAPVPSLSASVAHRLLSRSPLHAWIRHPRLNPDYQEETSDSFDLGSAVHAVLLEGRDDLLAVSDAPDWRTKEARVFRDEARANGKIPLLIEQADAVTRMVRIAKKALADCEALPERGSFEPERTLVYRHDGAWLRCRPDLMTRDAEFILSYKTTSVPADPDSYVRSLLNFGYEMQFAFESNGARALFGRAPRYVWVVQEVQAPYAVSLIGVTPELADFAQERFALAVSKWQRCLDSGKWPGYPSQICYVDVPPYLRASWEQTKLYEQMGEVFA